MVKLTGDICERITRRYPPIIANSPEQTITRDRIAEILEGIFANIPRLQRGKRLGLIDRMKFGGALREGLRETGYEDAFVDFAVVKFIEALERSTDRG